MEKNNISKTNVARLLDAAGISYELIPYEYSEDDLSAVHVAKELGENIEQVFKTLVLRGDRNGLFVCVIPGNFEVDLKLAAKLSGNKYCAMLHVSELLANTGYTHSGDGLPYRDEKTLPDICARVGIFIRLHLYFCRSSRIASQVVSQ